MKGIIIYDSTHGNTRKVAEIMAEILKEAGTDAEVFFVKEAKGLKAENYSFLAVGSPTRFGTMSFTMRFFLMGLKSSEWAGKPFVAFDTENPENKVNKGWSAAEKIAKVLEEKGLKKIAPALIAEVEGMKGPLINGEEEKIKEYSKKLAAILKK